jgi:hypothetical protein
MPNEQDKKRRITVETIFAAASFLLALFAYLRPPDPAHPTRFDFLSRSISIPFWLCAVLAMGIATGSAALTRWKIKSRANPGLNFPERATGPTPLPSKPASTAFSPLASASPATLAPKSSQSAVANPTTSSDPGAVRFETTDFLVLHIRRQTSPDQNALVLVVDNNRLDAIEHIDTIIYSACSFDSNHNQFRTVPAAAGARMVLHDVIHPSSSSKPVLIVAKRRVDQYLMMGDTTSNVMKWPENDKSAVQRWKFSLSVAARTYAKNSSQISTPLRLTKLELIVRWDSAANSLYIDSLIPESAPASGA